MSAAGPGDPRTPDLSHLLLPVPGEEQQSNGATAGVWPPPGHDQPAPELFKQASEDASALLRQEIALARAEMTEKAKEIGVGAGMFGGAGYVAHLASLGLMLCLIFALATVMPAWLAALVVTVVFVTIAAILAIAGRSRIKRAGTPVPEQTLASVKQTIETVKEDARWGLGQTR